MTEQDDALSLDMVTAALRADSTDVAIYARVLVQSLGEALPSDLVSVERDRTMSDRMRGRPGEISKIVARLGEQQMTLAVHNGQPVTEICRSVRGVVLSRQTVPIADWAAALATALVSYAGQNAQAAQALRKLVSGSLVAGEGGFAWAVLEEAAHAGALVFGAEQGGELDALDFQAGGQVDVQAVVDGVLGRLQGEGGTGRVALHQAAGGGVHAVVGGDQV